MDNFRDKSRYETIKQYLIRKSAEKEQKSRENAVFVGILLMMAILFIGLLI